MHKEMESSKEPFRFVFQAMEQSPVEYLEIDSTNSIFDCMTHTV